MGVPSASFFDTYSAKITELMVNLVEYVQAMDIILNPTQEENRPDITTRTGTRIGAGFTEKLPTQAPIQFENNSNDFPILPNPIPSEGWKKGTWDRFFTDYLGQIYHLACGGKRKLIPYKHISRYQTEFIDPKYLPRKTTFRCPRNIPLLEMKRIFEHLLKRQQIHGPEDTFKFRSIKFKGDIVPARYKTNDNDSSVSSSDTSTTSSIPNPTPVSTPVPTPVSTLVTTPAPSRAPSPQDNRPPSTAPNRAPSGQDNRGPRSNVRNRAVENASTLRQTDPNGRPRPRPRQITRSINTGTQN